MNYDDWKLSNPIDDGHGTTMVSNCCGSSFEEEVPVCAECESGNISEKCHGDEGWTICDDCGAIEQGYEYVSVCEECGDICGEIEDYEYNEIQKESWAEMRADAERDER